MPNFAFLDAMLSSDGRIAEISSRRSHAISCFLDRGVDFPYTRKHRLCPSVKSPYRVHWEHLLRVNSSSTAFDEASTKPRQDSGNQSERTSSACVHPSIEQLEFRLKKTGLRREVAVSFLQIPLLQSDSLRALSASYRLPVHTLFHSAGSSPASVLLYTLFRPEVP